MFEAEIECAVIGAGVVGLAVAREMALRGREVLVLEAADAIGTGISSRNSEVIHAGIYYPKDSLKARLCISGNKLTYAYCRERGIPHRQCGKLIVATNEAQIPDLAAIQAKAIANGVTDLTFLSAAEAEAMEPGIECVQALLSPSSGIVDTHALIRGYRSDIEAHNGHVVLESPVLGGDVTDGAIYLQVGGREPSRLKARMVVNCGGLDAMRIAGTINGLPADSIPPLYYAKGNYYALSTPVKFSRLVYPIPAPGGLGVHLTIDPAGNARFGPDVEWIRDINYDVDPARADAFYSEVRKYWPGLPDDALYPSYSGIRPKLHAPSKAARDFMIQGPEEHGVPGLCNLYGIESPGLTSALAIGKYVADLLG